MTTKEITEKVMSAIEYVSKVGNMPVYNSIVKKPQERIQTCKRLCKESG